MPIFYFRLCKLTELLVHHWRTKTKVKRSQIDENDSRAFAWMNYTALISQYKYWNQLQLLKINLWINDEVSPSNHIQGRNTTIKISHRCTVCSSEMKHKVQSNVMEVLCWCQFLGQSAWTYLNTTVAQYTVHIGPRWLDLQN